MSFGLDQIVQALQIMVSLAGFGGVAFSLGRIMGRIDNLEKGQREIRNVLFDTDDGKGAYVRRSEAEIMLRSSQQEHTAFDNRLNEMSRRLGVLEGRRG